MRVFLIGYPGEMGGANTEAWHTIKLWRRFGVDVHLIPTWGHDVRWRQRLDALGCITHDVTPDRLDTIAQLPSACFVVRCTSVFGRFSPYATTPARDFYAARNGKYPTVTGLLFSAYIINGLTTATDPKRS